MILKSGKLNLRPLEVGDAYKSVIWRNNSKIWELTLNSPDREISIEDEIKWIKKVNKETDSYRFAMIYSGIYIGNIQLTGIRNNESYYGIFIGETKYWGKGIGFLATRLIINYAFNTLKLSKIKLRVKLKNLIAHKLYKRLGFQEIDRDLELIYMEISKTQCLVNERDDRKI